MPSRQFHSKNRHGCLLCKARKVKCDLEKPVCTNCAKRQQSCSFLNENEVGTKATDDGLLNKRDIHSNCKLRRSAAFPSIGKWPVNFEVMLLNHFSAKVSGTLSPKPAAKQAWASAVDNAFSQAFLFHSILAISALHLSHLESASSLATAHYFRKLAMYHHAEAITHIRPPLENVNTSNYNALFVGGGFIFLVAAAAMPSEEEEEVEEEEDRYTDPVARVLELIALVKGTNSIYEEDTQFFRSGILRPILDLEPWDDPDLPPLPSAMNQVIQQDIKEVQQLLDTEQERREVLLHTLSQVTSNLRGMAVNVQYPTLIFMWFTLLDRRYVDMVRQRDPLALKIMMHYARMAKVAIGKWWVRGWADYLVRGLHLILASDGEDDL